MPGPLRNPFVLGALAILGAVIAAIVVALVLSEREGEGVIVVPARQPTARAGTPTRTTVPLEGVSGLALSTLTVRAGPGSGYISLGTARRGAELDVLGRNEEETWLEISYPPRSQLRGWVEADGVDLEGSVANLPIGELETLVLPAVPTYPPSTSFDDELEPTSTPEVPPGPDLVLSGAALVQGELVVTVTNQGDADADPPIDVAIHSGDGSTFLRLARVSETLSPGASVDLATHYEPADDQQRLIISIDPANRVEEANEDNNAVIFGVSEPPGSATPSPTALSGSPTATPRSSPQPLTPTQPASTSVPTETPTSTAPTPAPTSQSTPTVGG